MRCPKPECGAVIMGKDNLGVYRCSGCSFRIRDERFNEIVADLYKPKSSRAIIEDNAEALNNL